MPLEKYLILKLLLLLPIFSSAQQSFLDSMRAVYLSEKDPAKKIDAFYEIANERSYNNPQLGFAYADSLADMAGKAGYKKGLAMARHIEGFAYSYEGNYEKAMELFREELAIFVELGDRNEQSSVFTNLGSMWGNLGENDSSIAYYLKSLTIDEITGDHLGASINYNNIGDVYSDQGAHDKAIEYFERALAIRQDLGLEKRYTQCYINLASAYGRKGAFAEAFDYHLKALDLAEKYGNVALAGIITNSIGTDFNSQQNYQEAIPYLERSIGYFRDIGNEVYQTYPLYNLSMSYAGLGNGEQALAHAREGFLIVEALDLDSQLELYYKAFAYAHEANGEYRQALDWYRKYTVTIDSLVKVDNASKVAEMAERYESQKKEAQLTRQQLELERQANQKNTIIAIAVATLLLLTGLFQYFRNRLKARQKEAELAARLEHAKAEKLQEMDTLKSNFFANISHEFRTPLTLIISPLRQLLDRPSERPNPSLFRTMLLSGERLLELVNQLLDLAKAEAGQLVLKQEETDVIPVLRGVAGSFTSLADVRQIHFEMAMPATAVVARFDKDKLAKITSNLLSNAFKFTPEEGSVRMEVNTYPLTNPDGQAASHGLTLTVKDNGIGIAKSELPHLFERFYQVQTVEREQLTGTGIGLALTKELVDLHNGSIEVDSQPGTGTTFIVRLPIVVAVAGTVENNLKVEVLSGAMETVTRTETSTEDIFPNSGLPRVLIVEDNADVRHFIGECLKAEFSITLATDGSQGLEIARQSIPDLIISDVMMPHMDGFELCATLKSDSRTSHIPVILLTARAEKKDKLGGLETGADDYLIKPFDARELNIRVRNLIAQRKKLHEHYRNTLISFSPEPVRAENMDAVFLQNVKREIEVNLGDERFSVSFLGKKIGLSRSQLHRKLKALTGHSPNEIIRQMRLERAKQLLEKNAGSASEVAYLCGFSSPAYFSKCFKDHFGQLPSKVG